MSHLMDLVGQRFEKLTVIELHSRGTSKTPVRWRIRCDCGTEKVVSSNKLKNGYVKSCGCLRASRNGESATRLFRIWRNMHKRCEDPKRDHYDRYGGRGISVCKEWNDFSAFKEWALENGYSDALSIDRIDGNGNYEPNNCQWITQKEQMQNISTNKHIEFAGSVYTLSQFAEYLGVPKYTVQNRLRLGWNAEQIARGKRGSNESI